MSDTNTCLNKHSDFSVQPKPTHYEACGNMASLKLQGDSNLKEEADALLKIEEAAVEDLKNLEAFAQASLTKGIPCAESSQPHDNIELEQVTPGADAPSKPDILPGPSNAGIREHFQSLMKFLFKRSATNCIIQKIRDTHIWLQTDY